VRWNALRRVSLATSARGDEFVVGEKIVYRPRADEEQISKQRNLFPRILEDLEIPDARLFSLFGEKKEVYMHA